MDEYDQDWGDSNWNFWDESTWDQVDNSEETNWWTHTPTSESVPRQTETMPSQSSSSVPTSTVATSSGTSTLSAAMQGQLKSGVQAVKIKDEPTSMLKSQTWAIYSCLLLLEALLIESGAVF